MNDLDTKPSSERAGRVWLIMLMIVVLAIAGGLLGAGMVGVVGVHPSDGRVQFFLLAMWALIFGWRQFQRRLPAKDERLLRLKEEAVHKRRLLKIAGITALLAVLCGYELVDGVTRVRQGWPGDWSIAGAQAVISLLALALFLNWNIPAAKRLILDDELIRLHRSQAIQVGFWVFTVGALGLLALAQTQPLWAAAGLAPLVNLALIGVMVGFLWLEWRPSARG